MANTLNLGNGNWGVKKDSLLGYNSENGNFKPLAFNFTRNGCCATVVNKDGLIETVGGDIPRIDFSNDAKGALLLEPQRMNLITYSEEIEAPSKWETVDLTTVSNSIISPNGTLNGTKIIRNVVDSGSAWIRQRPTVVVGENYVVSIFGKIGNKSTLNITYYDATSGDRFFNYNLSTQSITGNGLSNSTYVDSGVEYYGNGWYRCYVVINALNTSPQIQISVGQNRLNSQGDFIYMYGAMLEQGSYATSYIPTQGSAVTRSADSCLQGGFQDKNIFGSNQGSAVFELKWDLASYVFDFNDSSGIRIRIFKSTSTWTIRDFGGAAWVNTGFTKYDNVKTKIGFKWNGTEFSTFQDGVKSSIVGTFASSMAIESITTNKLNNTSNMQFYNTALTDTELQALTK